jgi:bifunctional non-homologous end joining protein LigD
MRCGLARDGRATKSCLIDGEAIVTNGAGLADFEIMRQRRVNAAAVLIAFDLLELNGEDLRGLPIEKRKRELARLLKKATSHIVINEHFDADGAHVYREACRLGCEGIVSRTGLSQADAEMRINDVITEA